MMWCAIIMSNGRSGEEDYVVVTWPEGRAIFRATSRRTIRHSSTPAANSVTQHRRRLETPTRKNEKIGGLKRATSSERFFICRHSPQRIEGAPTQPSPTHS